MTKPDPGVPTPQMKPLSAPNALNSNKRKKRLHLLFLDRLFLGL